LYSSFFVLSTHLLFILFSQPLGSLRDALSAMESSRGVLPNKKALDFLVSFTSHSIQLRLAGQEKARMVMQRAGLTLPDHAWLLKWYEEGEQVQGIDQQFTDWREQLVAISARSPGWSRWSKLLSWVVHGINVRSLTHKHTHTRAHFTTTSRAIAGTGDNEAAASSQHACNEVSDTLL
jgi:hypothetical protein